MTSEHLLESFRKEWEQEQTKMEPADCKRYVDCLVKNIKLALKQDPSLSAEDLKESLMRDYSQLAKSKMFELTFNEIFNVVKAEMFSSSSVSCELPNDKFDKVVLEEYNPVDDLRNLKKAQLEEYCKATGISSNIFSEQDSSTAKQHPIDVNIEMNSSASRPNGEGAENIFSFLQRQFGKTIIDGSNQVAASLPPSIQFEDAEDYKAFMKQSLVTVSPQFGSGIEVNKEKLSNYFDIFYKTSELDLFVRKSDCLE